MDINRHLDEERIESYSRHTTSGSDLKQVEEHLLLCGSCRHRVELSDAYVLSMQHAAARVRKKRARAPWPLGVPRFAFAAVAAVLVLTVVLIPRKTPPPFAISLAATRGARIEAKAPEGTPLTMQLDVTGLPGAAAYKVEMVDRAGKQVWSGTFPGANVKPIPAGTYFVRLYSPTGELLREYGIEIGSSR